LLSQVEDKKVSYTCKKNENQDYHEHFCNRKNYML